MILFIVILFGAVHANSLVVTTNRGKVIGNEQDGYNTFFGIPYAKVDEENPFGNYLQNPTFHKPFIANDSTIMCPQVFGSENGIIQCLTLNIYVPTANVNNLRPVLVWFYGGGFSHGKAGDYGGKYLVQHDIVVVTVNYRLGPYGFLCLDDPTVPGNQGMKDQIAALRWLKENLSAFGGDASKITIAGESYGGGAIDLHLYSNYETLFDKAVIQSGSIFTEDFYMKPDYNVAVKIANYLGHTVRNTRQALKALAKEEPRNVMNATRTLEARLTVCKEKRFKGVQNFVDQDPYHLRKADRVKNTTIMIGYNSKEAFGFFANKPEEFYKNLGNVFYEMLKERFNFGKKELETLSGIVKAFYLGGKEIAAESMLELSDFYSDFIGNHAAEWSVHKFLEQGAKPYKYLFSYIGDSPYKNVTGVGAIHTEELKYLWDNEYIVVLTTDEQKMMRNRMTTLWSNFVKFGNPTPASTELLPIPWPPVEGDKRPTLNIDVNMSVQEHVYRHRIAFWDLFWKSYVKRSKVYS